MAKKRRRRREKRRKWRKKGRGSLRVSGSIWCCFLLLFDLYLLDVKGREEKRKREDKKRGKERKREKRRKRGKKEERGEKEAVLVLGVVELIFIDFWKVGDEEEFKIESNGGGY